MFRAGIPPVDPTPPYLTGALCCFIWLLSFKPSEPHLTDYLISRGFSEDQVNSVIYPVWGYAYLALLIISFLTFGLAPNLLSYKTYLLIGVCGRVFTRLVLLFGTSVWLMILMEVGYAMGSVAEVIFVSYAFRILPPDWYLFASSLTSACFVASHVVSGILGDVMLQTFDVPLRVLLVISASSVLVSAVVLLLFLPDERSLGRDATCGADRDRLLSLGGDGLTVGEETIQVDQERQSDEATSDRPGGRGWEHRLVYLKEFFGSLRQAWRSDKFGTLSVWYFAMYGLYGIVYGYETSYYYFKTNDNTDDTLGSWNGTVLGLALFTGTCSTILCTTKWLSTFIGRYLLAFFFAMSALSTASLALMVVADWPIAFAGLPVYFAAVLPAFARYNAFWGECLDEEDVRAKRGGSKDGEGEDKESSPPYILLALFNGIFALAVQDFLQGVLLSALGLNMGALWVCVAAFSLVSTIFIPYTVLVRHCIHRCSSGASQNTSQ